MILLKIDLDEQKKKKIKEPPKSIDLSLLSTAPTTVSLIWVGKLDVCMYVYKYIIV